MSDDLKTVEMRDLIRRWQDDNDRVAADKLITLAGKRLEHLARKMLRGFPQSRPDADTNDVLQNALIRLLRTLKNVKPDTTRDFFNLAAVHIRRELIDLARRLLGPKHRLVVASHQLAATRQGSDDESDSDFLAGAPGPQESPDELELWRRFHEAVDRLPIEEREVVSLTYYHDWNHLQIAEMLHICDRTVRRRWTAACLRLVNSLGGQLPQIND